MLPPWFAIDGAAMATASDLSSASPSDGRGIGAKVTATQVGLCLIDLKLARLVPETPSTWTVWSTSRATPRASGR